MSVVVEQEIPLMQRQILCIEDDKLVTETGGKTEEVLLTTINFTPVIAVERDGRRLVIAESILSEEDRSTIAKQRKEIQTRRLVKQTAYLE